MLPMPGDANPFPSPGDQSCENDLCRLFVIFHDMARCYYGAGNGLSIRSLDIRFAERIYRRLLDWATSLPLSRVRGDHNSHHITMMQ